ncbi:uncharacterized protein LOC108864717 [Galendromus occidentalis]|uniref:Uncharacterized protein LOC108864717 n=1 Tax=Galendromus occidentalis TaxID=34638 RepID=A0AAJ7L5K6_9ACAR|nr:uncharacterized protein LOC108864717 [Galendromus occidentalis]
MYRVSPTGTLRSLERKDGIIPFKMPSSRPLSTASGRAKKLFEAAAKRKAKIAKGIWIFVVICCVAGCLGQVFTFLEIFWKYPTIIDIETEKTDELQFPAVTICNMNRFRLSQWCRFKNMDAETCGATESTLSKDDDLFTLNRSLKIQMGHQLKSMVFETRKTVNGTVKEHRVPQVTIKPDPLPLHFRDVALENGGFREHFFHQKYSNCFVYNAEWSGSGMGEMERARQIDIEFTIFLEPKEYLNSKEVASAQIVFHHPECIPDPQENGIPIRSGYAHTFTLRHLITRRLTYPYWTDCRNYDMVKRDRYIIQMTKSVSFISI